MYIYIYRERERERDIHRAQASRASRRLGPGRRAPRTGPPRRRGSSCSRRSTATPAGFALNPKLKAE